MATNLEIEDSQKEITVLETGRKVALTKLASLLEKDPHTVAFLWARIAGVKPEATRSGPNAVRRYFRTEDISTILKEGAATIRDKRTGRLRYPWAQGKMTGEGIEFTLPKSGKKLLCKEK